MSENRQIPDSNIMDKEAENMDESSSSPAANLDELMNCDDIWEDEKFTCPRSPSAISEDSVMSYASSCCSFSGESRITYASSWCSCTDSEISETIAPSYQNVDEEIMKVCYSFLNPENMEKEEDDFGERDEVQSTEIGTSSRLSIRSEESARHVPSAASSSSSSTTAITEEAKMLVSQVIDEAVKTLHSTDFVSKAKRPAGKSFLKKLKAVRKSRFGRKWSKEVKNVSKLHVDKAIEDSGTSPKSNLSSCPLGLVEEEENVTLEETGNIVPSTTSNCSSAPPHQVDEIIRSESQPETAADSQEELRSSPSRQSRHSCDEVLRALPPEDDGHPVFKRSHKKSLWKRCLSVFQKKRIQPAPVERLDEAVRSGSTDLTSRSAGESKQGSHCSGDMSTLLELEDYVEDEDMTPEDIRKIISSLSSTRCIKPDHQVVEVTTDESKDKTRTSSHHQSIDFGDEDEVEEIFSQISVDQSQPASKCLSNNQDDVEETKTMKSKGFSSFFLSICSKKKEMKNEDKNKKASAEDQTKRRPLWMRLL